MKTVEERFYEKVGRPQPETGCMEWVAGTFTTGYGAFYVDGRPVKAHRFAYALWVGPLPAWTDHACPVVRHRCDNRLCVNPEHLEVGSPKDNVQDMNRRGRNGFSRRENCPRGHLLDGENLVPSELKKGRRSCRSCHRTYLVLYKRHGGAGRWTAEIFSSEADRRYAEIMGVAA